MLSLQQVQQQSFLKLLFISKWIRAASLPCSSLHSTARILVSNRLLRDVSFNDHNLFLFQILTLYTRFRSPSWYRWRYSRRSRRGRSCRSWSNDSGQCHPRRGRMSSTMQYLSRHSTNSPTWTSQLCKRFTIWIQWTHTRIRSRCFAFCSSVCSFSSLVRPCCCQCICCSSKSSYGNGHPSLSIYYPILSVSRPCFGSCLYQRLRGSGSSHIKLRLIIIMRSRTYSKSTVTYRINYILSLKYFYNTFIGTIYYLLYFSTEHYLLCIINYYQLPF